MTLLNSTDSPFARSAARPSAGRMARFYLKSLAHMVNGWIAALIAKRERQANLYMLRWLADHELRDIDLGHGQIGDGLAEAARQRSALQEVRQRQSMMS